MGTRNEPLAAPAYVLHGHTAYCGVISTPWMGIDAFRRPTHAIFCVNIVAKRSAARFQVGTRRIAARSFRFDLSILYRDELRLGSPLATGTCMSMAAAVWFPTTTCLRARCRVFKLSLIINPSAHQPAAHLNHAALSDSITGCLA